MDKKSIKNTINNINSHELIKTLENGLLEQLKQTYSIDNKISDDLLESLYFLYKNPLIEALHLLDKYDQPATAASTSTINCCVTELYTDDYSTRKIYQVLGSTGSYYYLFSNFSFCACSSYKFNVLKNFNYFYCKHQIVIKLSIALNKLNRRLISSSELADLIKLIK